MALVLFFEDWAAFLSGTFCWIYVDNSNSLAALVRGDANTEVVDVLVSRFWKIAQIRNVCF